MASRKLTIASARIRDVQTDWAARWRHREPSRPMISLCAPLPGVEEIGEIVVTGDDGAMLLTITDRTAVRALAPHCEALRQGFDNYPTLAPEWWVALDTHAPHLLPSLLGAPLHYTNDQHHTFTTWTEPLVASIEEVGAIRLPDLAAHPYCVELCRAIEALPAAWQELFPVQIAGASPIDCVAALLGTTEFYLGLHANPAALHAVLDLCTEATITLARLQIARCHRWCGPHGAPGLYVNDLVTEFLSPALWEAFVLPCYGRIAAAVGGLVCGLNSPDAGVLAQAVCMDGFLGGAVHQAIPLQTVIACLHGHGVYLLNSYPYNPAFDRPTVHRGVYYNPIVCSPSAAYREVYRELAGQVPLAVYLDRADRAEALRDGEALQTSR